MNIIIATIKSWNIDRAHRFAGSSGHTIEIISRKSDLTFERLCAFQPRYIFFPHWSWMIPKDVWERFECVVFHMTDVPYGRGGSPLQNLIIRGHRSTKVSALRAVAECDAGPVYMKEDMDLSGTASRIYERASDIIFNTMIPSIIENEPVPKPQQGDVVQFARRTNEEGNLSNADTIEAAYDFIRMLDAEGYPKAFIRLNTMIYEFSNAHYDGTQISASVVIRKQP